jgi:hypothetical protein
MTSLSPGTRRARKDKRAPARSAPRQLKSIVWLASYPKSGNTWTRVFLANYLLNTREPVPINQVHRIGLGDSISGAYWLAGGRRYDPADYLGHLRMRDRVLRGFVNNGATMNFVKTHNAHWKVLGTDLIPARYTRSAVYIVRNPLDVTVSYARHYGLTTTETVQRLSRADNGIAGDAKNVQQYLGDWSGHVGSWADARDFPVHVMRFEEMKQAPEASFSALLDFLGVPLETERLERAIRFSSFDEMQRQESIAPFVERSPNAERFFHSGETGQWKGALSPEDAEALRTRHAEVMARFGYL